MFFRHGKHSETEYTDTASQWQLIRYRFKNHKLARCAMLVLIVLYSGVIFSEFLATSDPAYYSAESVLEAPHTIRFVNENGKFSIHPFFYPRTKKLNTVTFREEYTEDRQNPVRLGFFVHGDPYKMWGLFPSDVHFFGTENPEYRFFMWGTDSMGRDMFSRIIYGSRISLTIGFVGILIGFIPSTFFGGLAGLMGGWVDKLLMRINETMGSIPETPLWIALAAALPVKLPVIRTYFYMVLIMALVGVLSGGSRSIRGKFMAVKREDFIMAARLDNVGKGRLIFLYMFPTFLSNTIASMTMSIPGMIMGETSLSFIGLGLQAPAISWGVQLQECRSIQNLAYAPWLFIPAVVLVVTVLAFNFFGDGLRDAVDPYSHV